MASIITNIGIGIASSIITNYGVTTICNSVVLINSVSDNIKKLMNNMSNQLTISGKTDTLNEIKKMDIEYLVAPINCMLSEIHNKNIPDNIRLMLDNIHNTAIEIEQELILLKNKLKYNESLYFFKMFRSYECESSLDKIRLLKQLLENRIQQLCQFVQLNKYMSELTIDHKRVHMNDLV